MSVRKSSVSRFGRGNADVRAGLAVSRSLDGCPGSGSTSMGQHPPRREVRTDTERLAENKQVIEPKLELPPALEGKTAAAEDVRRCGRIETMMFVERHAVRELQPAQGVHDVIDELRWHGDDD